MTEQEKEKLLNWKHENLSIGITDDGSPINIIRVPWKKTVNSYCMKLPDVYICSDDLKDEKLMQRICQSKIVGCYIMTALENYDFLSHFNKIRDLYITSAHNLKNIDFLKGNVMCDMIYLQNAKLRNLDAFINLPEDPDFICRTGCIGLYNCEIEDISALITDRIILSELLIWNPKSRNEEERWKAVTADLFKYCEFDETTKLN